MRGVAEDQRGTARAALAAMGPLHYSLAGKTCTAQVVGIKQNDRYDARRLPERLRDHALFIAFAPAEAPKLAVAVLVENGRSGSGTAAPIARKVFDAYFLPPQDAPATPVAPEPLPAGGNEE
jgi:penicillin-binding protein 2